MSGKDSPESLQGAERGWLPAWVAGRMGLRIVHSGDSATVSHLPHLGAVIAEYLLDVTGIEGYSTLTTEPAKIAGDQLIVLIAARRALQFGV